MRAEGKIAKTSPSMGIFTINGLSKRKIMKRLRKVKAYSEHSLWLAYGG